MATQLLQLFYRQTMKNTLYINPPKVLAFEQHGHGVSDENFPNDYALNFGLKTQQTSHDYLFLKLNNGSVSVGLHFLTRLGDSIELFFLSENASTIYIDQDRKVSKNNLLPSKIESNTDC